MSPHTPARGTQAAGEERDVDDCFSAMFPPTCRSALCASESKVSGRRRAGRKKSPAMRRSDGGGGSDGEFRKENKVTGMKHSHQKRN